MKTQPTSLLNCLEKDSNEDYGSTSISHILAKLSLDILANLSAIVLITYAILGLIQHPSQSCILLLIGLILSGTLTILQSTFEIEDPITTGFILLAALSLISIGLIQNAISLFPQLNLFSFSIAPTFLLYAITAAMLLPLTYNALQTIMTLFFEEEASPKPPKSPLVFQVILTVAGLAILGAGIQGILQAVLFNSGLLQIGAFIIASSAILGTLPLLMHYCLVAHDYTPNSDLSKYQKTKTRISLMLRNAYPILSSLVRVADLLGLTLVICSTITSSSLQFPYFFIIMACLTLLYPEIFSVQHSYYDLPNIIEKNHKLALGYITLDTVIKTQTKQGLTSGDKNEPTASNPGLP